MNTIQEAKLKMYRATENYCNENTAIISKIAAFQTAFNDFKAKVAAITELARQDDVPLTGITIDKNVIRQKLCELAASLASVIYAYASTVGNNQLKLEMDFAYSDLMKMRDDALPARCQNLLETGAANLAALADYGVTGEMLADLQSAIDEYAAANPKPRTAISERKTVTANLVLLFDEADAILKDRMDKLVRLFKQGNPGFVKTYESIRRIVQMPTITTQLRGIVTSRADGTFVKNAQITATNTTATFNYPPVTVAANADGEYLFKPLLNGTYKITVTAAGFNDFEAEDVKVKLGEITTLDIKLEK